VKSFKISVEAQKDIEKIWLYTFETWSIEQADRYINQIFEEIEYISKKPAQGDNFSDVRKGYFRAKVKLHYIFYKIYKETKIVEIIRVLHQRMDIEDRLKDSFE